jgi:hypothetical protein
MEKESNTNCMYETATMPSYFPCIKSSESHPLAQILEDMIEKEVNKRVEKEERIRALKKAQDEIGKY